MNILVGWFRRTFSDPQVVILAVLLLLALAILAFAGRMLAPVIASIIVAYLLEGGVAVLMRLALPRIVAVILVFLLFLSALLGLFLVLMPLLLGQAADLARELPAVMTAAQDLLLRLPERYPQLIQQHQVLDLVDRMRSEVVLLGQNLVVYSVAWLPTLVTLATYLVLMPVLVFFFLKDKDPILSWFLHFLPVERPLVDRIWHQVSGKVGRYVRGKAYEIVIVGIATYLVFAPSGLQFSALLAAVTGLVVVIPYIGTVLAAVPVAAVAYGQWGTGGPFWWVIAAFAVIQSLDGYVLAPLLLGGAVDLHPNAVIVAILLFGGLWGFWGVFFAIPLATLVQSILVSWPGRKA